MNPDLLKGTIYLVFGVVYLQEHHTRQWRTLASGCAFGMALICFQGAGIHYFPILSHIPPKHGEDAPLALLPRGISLRRMA